MRILGVSAFQKDAAAALVVDGVPVAAAREERFSKKPHDGDFPTRSIRFCMETAGISSSELDRVVFYQKPLRRFERLLATRLQAFPRSSRTFATDMFLWLGDRLWMKSRIAGDIGVDVSKVAFVAHQESLAAGAFFPSGLEEAALLVVGDGGEWAASSLGRGGRRGLELLEEIHFPHSLGRLSAALTQFLGFVPGADGGRLEALAAHGSPRFQDLVEALVPEREDGGYSIDSAPFRFPFDDERLYDKGLEERLGPARFPGQPLEMEGDSTRHADLAASVQLVLEERVLSLARRLHQEVQLPDLCFTGELARNKRLVHRLAADGPFERLHVPASPGEAGAALGAALAVEHAARSDQQPTSQDSTRPAVESVWLGEAIDTQEQGGAHPLEDPIEELAGRIAGGECLAWVRGRMELSRESLGSRVLLADPCRPDSRRKLLGAVQQSEPWLPARLVVTAARAAQYVDLPPLVGPGFHQARATPALQACAPEAVQPEGRVWVRVIDPAQDPVLTRLLETVERATGHPLLFMETFRLRGSPMVRNEFDATEAFARSSLDALVAGERLYTRDS